MFGNLQGWHVLIILLVVVVIVVAVVVVVAATSSSRRAAGRTIGGDPAGAGASPTAPRDVSERLAELKCLWNDGEISDAEYEAQRRQIIGGL